MSILNQLQHVNMALLHVLFLYKILDKLRSKRFKLMWTGRKIKRHSLCICWQLLDESWCSRGRVTDINDLPLAVIGTSYHWAFNLYVRKLACEMLVVVPRCLCTKIVPRCAWSLSPPVQKEPAIWHCADLTSLEHYGYLHQKTRSIADNCGWHQVGKLAPIVSAHVADLPSKR